VTSTKPNIDVEVCESMPWLVDHCYGWQFGEQGVLIELCRRLGIDRGYEVGAGDGDELPVTLDFMRHLTLYEIEQDKRGKLRVKYPLATIHGAYEPQHATLIKAESCVIVDIDSDDLAIAEEIAETAAPYVMMVEHYDRQAPWMATPGVMLEPDQRVPDWLVGMSLAHGFRIQQPWQVVQESLGDFGYRIVALTRVNGINVHKSQLEKLCQ